MSTPRIAALFLMTAGFGWTAGNFAQPDTSLGRFRWVLLT